MPLTLTPSEGLVYSATIAVPADGDDVEENTHVPPFQLLLDNTVVLKANVDELTPLIAQVNSLLTYAPVSINGSWGSGVLTTTVQTVRPGAAITSAVRTGTGYYQLTLNFTPKSVAISSNDNALVQAWMAPGNVIGVHTWGLIYEGGALSKVDIDVQFSLIVT